MKIYGKKNALDNFSAMIKNNRLAHSFLIFGEKGTGKKFFAEYMAMMLLCNNKLNDMPCEKCRECSNIIKNVHADVVKVPHSGKMRGFSSETIRDICRQALVFPNDGDKKIYIFEDCDTISVSAQNILLKTIEEPPEFAYFIFTASSKDVFLETIISRVVSLGISECSKDECCQVLKEHNFSDSDIANATETFGGNIGNCISYITDENFRNTAELTKQLAECIINNDEYGFLSAISSSESDRNILRQVIHMLDGIIRDSIVMKYNENLSSECFDNVAKKMSETVSLAKCYKIHLLLNHSDERLNANVNIRLITASLCSGISNH